MPNKKLLDFKTTAEISVPQKIIDQVIGQEKAVEIIKKAADHKRNVLLIGDPGTGKSLLAQAMSELLPTESLEDILVYPNQTDPNNPKIVTVKAGEGRKVVAEEKKKRFQAVPVPGQGMGGVMLMSLLYSVFVILAIYLHLFSDVITAAFIIVGALFVLVMMFASTLSQGMSMMRFPSSESKLVPKLLVDNAGKQKAPFVDATGARAGALLGDVRHDPYQSGGLGTPPHLRVEPGFIHRAHRGVLFVDEVATLSPKSQQELLTAMQEKKYSITGQSEMSSGAMVRTEPVPCDFVLVASGNVFDLQKMHPALRSRIRGYGYEVYLNKEMPDTPENRERIARFVAQEVEKDKKIPHFTKEAVEEIIFEAKRRAGKKNSLTLHLRDLGGLVRAAGDTALSVGSKLVERKHVLAAKNMAKTMEQQIADEQIILKKEYEVFSTKGTAVGKVNGLAVIGSPGLIAGGMILPIEARVSPALSASAGRLIATGKLGEIAKEAVQNVSAIIKGYRGKGVKGYDIHIQFLQTYEGVEGDSASVSVAAAVISSLEKIPVRQDVAVTGSLSVNGEVLPVGGVSSKIEAAIEAGIKTVVIPEANKEDVILPKEKAKKVRIVAVKTIDEALDLILADSKKKTLLIRKIQKLIK